MSDLASTLLYGSLLIPIAILGIAARVRRVRARRARPTDWARYDVPTVIRRRTGGETTMSGGINTVILIGNRRADPNVRTMQSGDAVATVSLASTQSWKDRNTGEARSGPNGTASVA